MKTVIAIIGNSCIGKSTIARILSENTGFPVYDIQQYYDKVDGVGHSKELKAWDLLGNAIKNCHYAILESSGLTDEEQTIYKLFDKRLIVKLIHTNTFMLVQRYKEKLSRMEFPLEIMQSGHLYDLIRMRAKIYEKLESDLVFDVQKISAENIAKEIELKISL